MQCVRLKVPRRAAQLTSSSVGWAFFLLSPTTAQDQARLRALPTAAACPQLLNNLKAKVGRAAAGKASQAFRLNFYVLWKNPINLLIMKHGQQRKDYSWVPNKRPWSFIFFKGKNHPGRGLLSTGRLFFLWSDPTLVVYQTLVV